MVRITIQYRMWMYAGVFGLSLASWLATPVFLRPRAYSIPSSKVTTYLAARNGYRLLFVGDSRTYTDIQPRVIDPITARPSYNLASFGLWMPVQYLEFRDVFKNVPKDTVIIWSLSHHNFVPIGDRWWIPGQYAFGIADLAEYILDGYPVKRAIQEYEESPYSPVDIIVKGRKKFLASLEQVVLRRHVHAISPGKGLPTDRISGDDDKFAILPVAVPSRAELNSAAAAKILERLKRDTRVTSMSPVAKDGITNSIETTRADGGYDRIVIDREFFQEQQSKLWPPHTGTAGVCQFEANQVYMKTFNKILDLVSRYRLHMIVNYIEDAPGSWPSDSERRCAKQFMLNRIVPILKKRGMGFVDPDFYPHVQYSNDLYFDNSHLTSEGAAIYSRLLGCDMNKILSDMGW